MSALKDDKPQFEDVSPKTRAELDQLLADYRKAFGREMPEAVVEAFEARLE